MNAAARATAAIMFGPLLQALQHAGIQYGPYYYSYPDAKNYQKLSRFNAQDTYLAADTHASMSADAQRLNVQIQEILTNRKSPNYDPQATFDLVGDGLGGVVAAYWVVAYTTPSELARAHSLIAYDSPMQGFSGTVPSQAAVYRSGAIAADLLHGVHAASIAQINNIQSGLFARLPRVLTIASLSNTTLPTQMPRVGPLGSAWNLQTRGICAQGDAFCALAVLQDAPALSCASNWIGNTNPLDSTSFTFHCVLTVLSPTAPAIHPSTFHIASGNPKVQVITGLPSSADASFFAQPSAPAYQPQKGFATDIQRLLALLSLQISLQRYQSANLHYPATLAALCPMFAPQGPNGQELAAPPVDPDSGQPDTYSTQSNGQEYLLTAILSAGRPYTVGSMTDTGSISVGRTLEPIDRGAWVDTTTGVGRNRTGIEKRTGLRMLDVPDAVTLDDSFAPDAPVLVTVDNSLANGAIIGNVIGDPNNARLTVTNQHDFWTALYVYPPLGNASITPGGLGALYAKIGVIAPDQYASWSATFDTVKPSSEEIFSHLTGTEGFGNLGTNNIFSGSMDAAAMNILTVVATLLGANLESNDAKAIGDALDALTSKSSGLVGFTQDLTASNPNPETIAKDIFDLLSDSKQQQVLAYALAQFGIIVSPVILKKLLTVYSIYQIMEQMSDEIVATVSGTEAGQVTFATNPSPPTSTPIPPTNTSIPTTAPIPPTVTPIPVQIPGDVWISPMNAGTSIGHINFSAEANPTNSGDPAIAYVNFTIGWPAPNPTTWVIACAVHNPTGVAPDGHSVYSCNIDPTILFPVPLPGQVMVSFDVYDQAGRVNKAPDGERIIQYLTQPVLCNGATLTMSANTTTVSVGSPIRFTVQASQNIGNCVIAPYGGPTTPALANALTLGGGTTTCAIGVSSCAFTEISGLPRTVSYTALLQPAFTSILAAESNDVIATWS